MFLKMNNLPQDQTVISPGTSKEKEKIEFQSCQKHKSFSKDRNLKNNSFIIV